MNPPGNWWRSFANFWMRPVLENLLVRKVVLCITGLLEYIFAGYLFAFVCFDDEGKAVEARHDNRYTGRNETSPPPGLKTGKKRAGCCSAHERLLCGFVYNLLPAPCNLNTVLFPLYDDKKLLYAVDPSARASMKTAASCEN